MPWIPESLRRAVTGGLSHEERRTLGPGYRAMRSGGRAQFTPFTEVPGESRRAIKNTWMSFARETIPHREVFFRHIFKNLTPAQLRDMRRLRVTQDELVHGLAHADERYLRRLLTHEKVVHHTKIAADRFFLKNVSGVLLKAVKERKGLFNFTPGSARDDIATGILAALHAHGLPDTEIHVSEDDSGSRRRKSRPTPIDVSEPGSNAVPTVSEFDVPSVSEPGSEVVPTVSGDEAPVQMPPVPDMNTLMQQMLAPKAIKVASHVQKGLRHHIPSMPFFSETNEAQRRHRVAALLEHASQFTGHVMATGLKASDSEKLVNRALTARNVFDFQDQMAKTIDQSTLGRDPVAILGNFLIPRGKLFDSEGKAVKHVSIENYDKLRHGKTFETSQKLSEEQVQSVAFHLAAKLAQLGSPKHSKTHFKRFVKHVDQSAKDAVQNYYKMHYVPRKLTNRQMLQLHAANVQMLYNIAQHGNSVEGIVPQVSES